MTGPPIPADAPLCPSGKRPFRDRPEALDRLAAARAGRARDSGPQRRPGDVESDVYRCAACKWWHLTSTTRRRRRGDIANRGRRR